MKLEAQSRLCLYPRRALQRYNSKPGSFPACVLGKRDLSVNVWNLQGTVFMKSLEGYPCLPVKECVQVPTPWTKSALLVSTEESLKRRNGRGEARCSWAHSCAERRATNISPCSFAECEGEKFQALFSSLFLNSYLRDLFWARYITDLTIYFYKKLVAFPLRDH